MPSITQYFTDVLSDLLWKAPELLRVNNAPRRGTQEGDVYSFAIIMYEIHGRKGPYGDTELSPKGTLNICHIIYVMILRILCN